MVARYLGVVEAVGSSPATRTTSSRTAYRSRRRFLFQSKRRLSFTPSLLLTPQSRRLCGDPKYSLRIACGDFSTIVTGAPIPLRLFPKKVTLHLRCPLVNALAMLRLAANFLRVRACSKIFRRQLFRYFLHDGVKFALLRHLLMLWHSHFALPFVKVTFGALIRLYAHLRQRVLLLARQIRLCDQNKFLYSILVEMSAVRSVFSGS